MRSVEWRATAEIGTGTTSSTRRVVERVRLSVLLSQQVRSGGLTRSAASQCVAGAWTAAEEQELTNLVMEAREKIATGSEDNDTDIFWGEIAAKMDHRRSRQQCRTKWCGLFDPFPLPSQSPLSVADFADRGVGSFRQEQLEKKESAGEKAKWCKNDAFILVRKCVPTFRKNALAQDCS